jgi:hypothetical protein
MSDPTRDDPAVVGVPDDVPEPVKPSATGLGSGPAGREPDVAIADSRDDEVSSTIAAGGEPTGAPTAGAPDVEGPNSV